MASWSKFSCGTWQFVYGSSELALSVIRTLDRHTSGTVLAKFKKKQKLLRRSDFTLTMDRGTKVVTPCVVLLGRMSESGQPRVGFIVSKKVGGAVTRNLVKRRLREVYRMMDARATPLDLVVIARVGADRFAYEDLQKSFVDAIGQLESKISRRRPEAKNSTPTVPAVSSTQEDKKHAE